MDNIQIEKIYKQLNQENQNKYSSTVVACENGDIEYLKHFHDNGLSIDKEIILKADKEIAEWLLSNYDYGKATDNNLSIKDESYWRGYHGIPLRDITHNYTDQEYCPYWINEMRNKHGDNIPNGSYIRGIIRSGDIDTLNIEWIEDPWEEFLDSFLEEAIRSGNIKMCEIICEYCDRGMVDFQDFLSHIDIYGYLIKSEYIEVIEWMIQNICILGSPSIYNYTHALIQGNIDIIELFDSIDIKYKDGWDVVKSYSSSKIKITNMNLTEKVIDCLFLLGHEKTEEFSLSDDFWEIIESDTFPLNKINRDFAHYLGSMDILKVLKPPFPYKLFGFSIAVKLGMTKILEDENLLKSEVLSKVVERSDMVKICVKYMKPEMIKLIVDKGYKISKDKYTKIESDLSFQPVIKRLLYDSI